jgi:isopropylmalate/homocitrate/citramalate synthase
MRIQICDVAPRDGLQSDPRILPSSTRAKLCARLAGCGLPRVEVASFVNESVVPQMAGAEAVVRALPRDLDTTWAGLVLNSRGCDRAIDAGIRRLHAGVAATDEFGIRNAGLSVAEALDQLTELAASARDAGAHVTGVVIVAFGCPFEGVVQPGAVAGIAERMVKAGADEVVFADTIGCAVPRQVAELLSRCAHLKLPLGFHLHNTRNSGYANALAAVEHGAGMLDASAGGLGGCPFAPRATGNIATEDLVWLLEREGVKTGVDLDRLLETVAWLEEHLGHELPGLVHRAGGSGAPGGYQI